MSAMDERAKKDWMRAGWACFGSVLLFMYLILWTEPICREGFVSNYGANGWYCVPGYKPHRGSN